MNPQGSYSSQGMFTIYFPSKTTETTKQAQHENNVQIFFTKTLLKEPINLMRK
jgi:hypothetical protein